MYLGKSNLCPSQRLDYLVVSLDSVAFRATPSARRVETFLRVVGVFRSSVPQPAGGFQALLGHLASLLQLVHNSRLRLRSLHLDLQRHWVHLGRLALLPWSAASAEDLGWWTSGRRLQAGKVLSSLAPGVVFWSDASGAGWGASLLGDSSRGSWGGSVASFHVNARGLLAVEQGLLSFEEVLRGRAVSVFCVITTATAYLRGQGGLRSEFLGGIAQRILCWAEASAITLLPQFIAGERNVVADALSRPGRVLNAGWGLCPLVFRDLRRRWPVNIALFATSLTCRCRPFFSPLWDPLALGVGAMLQSWRDLQAYAFPPFALLPRVLARVRQSGSLQLTLIAPFWPRRSWFPDLPDLLVGVPVPLPLSPKLLRRPHLSRFHRILGMLALLAWRLSSDAFERPASLVGWLPALSWRGASRR